jgi:hypothetical protein
MALPNNTTPFLEIFYSVSQPNSEEYGFFNAPLSSTHSDFDSTAAIVGE